MNINSEAWKEFCKTVEDGLQNEINNGASQRELESSANILIDYLNRDDTKAHPMFSVIEVCVNYAIAQYKIKAAEMR